jgi:hypothetical protein
MTARIARSWTFEVAGFTADVSMPRVDAGLVTSAVVEWTPRVPNFETDFTAEHRAEYRLKLITAIAEVRR